ncbi:MAG: hypothetical protein FE835_16690 [Gammaproteobacteria bacterium]|nr:hypothetical protein [Gammaproteobacteria bacterium]
MNDNRHTGGIRGCRNRAFQELRQHKVVVRPGVEPHQFMITCVDPRQERPQGLKVVGVCVSNDVLADLP